ncbi:MAG: MFS transporter [Chloroflexota bacterium]
MLPSLSTTPFARDKFTWLAYLMLGMFAYLQAGLGPVMPFLRGELNLSYTSAGLHFSAFSLGAVVTGLVSDKLAGRYGRKLLFWGGGALLVVGALLLIMARHPAATITASFCMGLCGSTLLVMIQAGLSDHHGERRTIALTEANVMAIIFAGLAPLLIGGGQQAGLGWRTAIWLPVAIYFLLLILFRHQAIPDRSPDDNGAEPDGRTLHPLPLLFWAYWLVLILGIAIEWCVIYWGADFLTGQTALSPEMSASLMGSFFLAMLIGRVTGSRLARRFTTASLLIVAIVITVAGFPLFWLGTTTPLKLVGLFVFGLGQANLYPLGLAAAMEAAPAQANTVSARITLGGGASVLAAPLLLGWLADRVGIHNAFAVVAILLILVLSVALIAYQLTQSQKIAPSV